LAHAAGSIAIGGGAEGLREACGFMQSGHGRFGRGDRLACEFTQLPCNDVERRTARPELGAFHRGVEAYEAHVGLDFLHRLDVTQQDTNSAEDGRGHAFELAALGFAIAQYQCGVAHSVAQHCQRRSSGRVALAIDGAALIGDGTGICGEIAQRVAGLGHIAFEGIGRRGELGNLQASHEAAGSMLVIFLQISGIDQVAQCLEAGFDMLNALTRGVAHLQSHDGAGDTADDLARHASGFGAALDRAGALAGELGQGGVHAGRELAQRIGVGVFELTPLPRRLADLIG
jgi:hypothetical protein